MAKRKQKKAKYKVGDLILNLVGNNQEPVLGHITSFQQTSVDVFYYVEWFGNVETGSLWDRMKRNMPTHRIPEGYIEMYRGFYERYNKNEET
jgi:hypothetical protein